MAGRHKGNLNPERCVASVSTRDRYARWYQCRRKRKPGSEWCGTHQPADELEGRGVLWGVTHGFREDPFVEEVPILKEGPKTITLAKSAQSFEWRTRIGKASDGTLEMGARTKEAAIRRYIAECEADLKKARLRVATAAGKLQSAKGLLEEECLD